MSSRRDQWNARYEAADAGRIEAARVLREHAHLLPAAGAALDVACGLGGNALWLAEHGLRVSAWDISDTAIARLRELAARAGVTLDAEVRDVQRQPPAPASFDLIAVSRFLCRELCPALSAALRPGGLLFYQTFVREKAGASGPRNPDYLLADNELLQLFAGLRVLSYRDEGRVGDLRRGFRDESWLVAQRREVQA